MIKFKFLKDEPISNSDKGFFDFYHKTVVPALKEIIQNPTCVHTIGLFGKWGTGKSTVIRNLQESGIEDTIIVEFDCWKYEQDSFRRQLLLTLADTLEVSAEFKKELQNDFYYSLKKEISEELNVSWRRALKVFLLSLPILIILGICYWILFDSIKDHLETYAAITVGSYATLFVLMESLIKDDFKNIISVSPVYGLHNRLDLPEQFEEKFKEIILHSTKAFKQLLIIVDNLDRVDHDNVRNILTTLKTFLEIKAEGKETKRVTFLVPCDNTAIIKILENSYKGHEVDAKRTAEEYLRKVFNVTIWMPDFIDLDLQDYTKSLLLQTECEEILNKETIDDVTLVINAAFRSNPREIKQFINNFLSYLQLASHTNVYDSKIKNNVPYATKLLIIRQLFPIAYNQLVIKWNKTAEVSSNENGYNEFMTATLSIDTENVQPFIHFKKPKTYAELPDSENFGSTLLKGDMGTAHKMLISYVKNKQFNKVLDYTSGLLSEYSNEINAFPTALNTILEIIDLLGKKITLTQVYLKKIIFLITNNGWINRNSLNHTLIFKQVLQNSNSTNIISKPLRGKYISTFYDSDYKDALNVKSSPILPIIKANLGTFTEDEVKEIKIGIEQNFIYDGLIIFDNHELQSKLVSESKILQLGNDFSKEKLNATGDIFLMFEEYIRSLSIKDQLGVGLLAQVQQILSATYQTQGVKDENMITAKNAAKVVKVFKDVFPKLGVNLQQEFANSINHLITNVGLIWNDKAELIRIEEILRPFTIPSDLQGQFRNNVHTFLIQSDYSGIQNFFETMNQSDIQSIFLEYEATFQEIMRRNDSNASSLILFVYSFLDEQKQFDLISYLVQNTTNLGIDVLNALDTLPRREDLLRIILSKTQELSQNDRLGIYMFTNKTVTSKDPQDVIDKVKANLNNAFGYDSLIGYIPGWIKNAKFLSRSEKSQLNSQLPSSEPT